MRGERINGGDHIGESTPWDELSEKSEAERDKEILESEVAQNILPYLTLDELSDHEKAELLRLSSENLAAMRDGRLPKDKFDTFYFVEHAIARAANEGQAWSNREIPPKLGEARKLFCASLLNATDDSESPNAKWDVYNAFFGMSPDFASYCGGLKGSLELLTIAERTNQNPCAREIYDEIIYDYSFAKFNAFEDALKDAKPIEQLRLLPICRNIAKRCDPDSYSRSALTKILDAFETLEQSDKAAPLVKLLSREMGSDIIDGVNAEWIDIDLNNPEHADLARRDQERRERHKLEQSKLHEEFPSLPTDYQIKMVAPDIAGAVVSSNGKIDLLADASKVRVSLQRYKDDNEFGIDRNMAFLLGTAHEATTKAVIDESLGIDLADVPLEAQMQLLKYMTEADNNRFDSLCSALHGVKPDLRLKLAEGFLAADFGEDFGDALLDIANSERISGEQLEEILDQISSCRRSIKGITGLYADFDGGKFAKEYSRAANERLTDVITVFKEIADNGVARGNLGWAGEIELDYNTAMEALKYEADSLAIINGTVSDVISGKDGVFAEKFLSPDTQHTRSMYNFYSPNYGYVMLYTRPEGSSSFDPTIEYGKYRNRYDEEGKNIGAEASISMIVNPINPFELPNPYRPNRHKIQDLNYYDGSTMNKVSAIRIDREGRSKDMSHDDENRNPINENGLASVDLAAIGDRADTPSGKIARLISVGNQLRKNAGESELSLNHNIIEGDYYGKASEFKKLVDYIDKSALALCAIHPPRKTEGFTGAKRAEKQRERARKAMSRAA